MDEEAVGGFVIWAFREAGLGEGLFEVAVEVLAPGVDFGPGHVAAFDGEELVAVGFAVDGDAAEAEGGSAGEEEAEEMHGVFPADFAMVTDVLLDFLNWDMA